MRSELAQLALDVYNGTSQYSEKEGNDVIRNMIIEKVGAIPENPSKFARYMEKHHIEIFEILEEMITAVHNEISLDAFGELVKSEQLPLGTRKDFVIDDAELFQVAQMATGVNVTQRQKFHNRKVATEGFRLGVKIYAELFDFLTGKINWSNLVDRVAKSFDRKVSTLVTGVLFEAYDELDDAFKAAVNKDALADELRDLVIKLEDNIGRDVAILGTKTAIAKIENVYAEQVDAQERKSFGFVKMFEGTPIVELPNYYDAETKAFDVPNDKLLIVPANEAIAVCNYEGDVIVKETLQGEREDDQIEMQMMRIIHLGVAVANKFGMIQLND